VKPTSEDGLKTVSDTFVLQYQSCESSNTEYALIMLENISFNGLTINLVVFETDKQRTKAFA